MMFFAKHHPMKKLLDVGYWILDTGYWILDKYNAISINWFMIINPKGMLLLPLYGKGFPILRISPQPVAPYNKPLSSPLSFL